MHFQSALSLTLVHLRKKDLAVSLADEVESKTGTTIMKCKKSI